MSTDTLFDDSSNVRGAVIKPYKHSEQVLEWRKDCFRRFRFAPVTADYLAKTRIDLRMMEDLLKKGCAPELAIQILVGTQYCGDDPAPFYEDPEDFELEDPDDGA